MLKLGKNKLEEFSYENEMNNDTKYIFGFDADIVFGELVNGKEINEKLQRSYENNDAEEFISVYNKEYFPTCMAHITEIHEMYGPGGEWPFVHFVTVNPMTFKEFVDRFAEEFGNPYEDSNDEIEVHKIIE